jgi:hypothetical protein
MDAANNQIIVASKCAACSSGVTVLEGVSLRKGLERRWKRRRGLPCVELAYAPLEAHRCTEQHGVNTGSLPERKSKCTQSKILESSILKFLLVHRGIKFPGAKVKNTIAAVSWSSSNKNGAWRIAGGLQKC